MTLFGDIYMKMVRQQSMHFVYRKKGKLHLFKYKNSTEMFHKHFMKYFTDKTWLRKETQIRQTSQHNQLCSSLYTQKRSFTSTTRHSI